MFTNCYQEIDEFTCVILAKHNPIISILVTYKNRLEILVQSIIMIIIVSQSLWLYVQAQRIYHVEIFGKLA